MLILFSKQFAFPIPGIAPGRAQGSVYCPGCKALLDEYGIHLLNCHKISTKSTPDPFSKNLLHNSLADKLVEIASHKFYCVGTNPKGERNCPILADGKTRGHLDLQFDLRDGSNTRILGDVSVGNPLAEQPRGAPPKKRNVIDEIRAKKNTKYRIPITSQHPLNRLAVYAFTMYGQMSSEVLALLADVADYVQEQNPLLPEGVVNSKYKRELACVLHKGIARVLHARISLLRVSTNQLMRHYTTVHELAVVIENEALADQQNVD
jgi:hypothetical protein